MATYLLKTEPSDYSFEDFVRDRTCVWSGVSNPTALIHLRATRRGDDALIYHTGGEKAVVGLARVTKPPYEDPERPGQTGDGHPKFAVIELAPVRAAKTPLALTAMRADRRFAEFVLLRQARLSVMPVPSAIDALIRDLTGL